MPLVQLELDEYNSLIKETSRLSEDLAEKNDEIARLKEQVENTENNISNVIKKINAGTYVVTKTVVDKSFADEIGKCIRKLDTEIKYLIYTPVGKRENLSSVRKFLKTISDTLLSKDDTYAYNGFDEVVCDIRKEMEISNKEELSLLEAELEDSIKRYNDLRETLIKNNDIYKASMDALYKEKQSVIDSRIAAISEREENYRTSIDKEFDVKRKQLDADKVELEKLQTTYKQTLDEKFDESVKATQDEYNKAKVELVDKMNEYADAYAKVDEKVKGDYISKISTLTEKVSELNEKNELQQKEIANCISENNLLKSKVENYTIKMKCLQDDVNTFDVLCKQLQDLALTPTASVNPEEKRRAELEAILMKKSKN